MERRWFELVGIALTLLAVAESLLHARAVEVAHRPLYFVVFALLGVATTLPLVLLRKQPAAAAIVISATIVLSLVAFQTLTVAGVCAQLIAGFRLGRSSTRLPIAVLAVLLALPFPLLALSEMEMSSTAPVGTVAPPPPEPVEGPEQLLVLLLACLAPAAALAGIAWRGRSEAIRSSAAVQEIAGTLTEHTARSERARIARELHDVVAHHISMVAVQAETARLTTPGMPEAGAERLSAIGDTARAALTEMRRLLGVLREDAEPDPVADRRPQPGLRLRELNDLLDEAREASGTGVRLILRGTPVTLDPGVELAAYRIIQEALTNARRHAPGAAVDVELGYGADLQLIIRDNGPGPSGSPDGLGLSGMRERAAAVGGDLRTGAAAGGGFLIEAHLPGATS